MTYSEFISQFRVYDNPPEKKGYHRHHIIPVSEQTTPDNRQVYLTLPQHMWAHILYDRENGTKTASYFLNVCNKPIEFFTSYELCLAYSYTLRKKCPDNSCEKNPFYGQHHKEEVRKKISESRKGKCVGGKNPMYGRTGEKHPMYGKHLPEEIRKKLSEKAKLRTGEKSPMYGKHWYNNGTVNLFANECPEGFVLGRLSNKRPRLVQE